MSREDGPAFAATSLRTFFGGEGDQRDAAGLQTRAPRRRPNSDTANSASEGIRSVFEVKEAEDGTTLHSLFDCSPIAFNLAHQGRARPGSCSRMDVGSVLTSHSSEIHTTPRRSSDISFGCGHRGLDGRRVDALGYGVWH